MSIFDMLKKAWADSEGAEGDGGDAADDAVRREAPEPERRKGDVVADVKSRVQREAAELAAKQALAAAKAAVTAAGEELLGDLEGSLAREQDARKDRKPVGPDESAADAIAARVTGAAERTERVRTQREDREARAREELARIKAEMKAAEKAAAEGDEP